MEARVSRRTFLAGLGTGAASAAAVWGLWQYLPWGAAADRAAAPANYVDYGGWIVTKADKDRLTSTGGIRVLESTSLDGRGLADQIVPDVESCTVWCLNEPDCQGFTYAKPTHPDPNVQKRCWLKGTSQLRQVADPAFTSGLR